MYQKSTLENGLRIITCNMPHTRSVSIVIFIGAGSRYETPEESGISHFIEHMCFKGTKKRAEAKQISEAIEGVGGILNASTDKELTIYWCRVARPHFPLALDVLTDMLLSSKFDSQEIEKERKVILEEINMTLDSPQERVDTLIDEVIWPDQPLGKDVGGTKETINSISRDMILGYLSHQYIPSNAVISAVGDITHEETAAAIKSAFDNWAPSNPRPWFPALDGQSVPRLKVEFKKTEQAHLILAVRGLSLFHPDRYTLDLLSVILGDGMSSRLFVQLREKMGFAYSVHSYVNHFLDSGSMDIYAGVDPKRIKDAINAILLELNKIKDGIPEEELTKAKEFSKGRMLLRMEDTRSVAGWFGAQEILTDRIITVDEIVSIVDAITAQDLARVARELFVTEKLNLAVVGPYRSEKGVSSLIKL